MHILLVAPSAPPKNSPEAMQVGRFLEALDDSVVVTLVTTPTVAGWEMRDSTLAVRRPNLQVIEISLPLQKVTQRFVSNSRLSRFHVPDVDFWLPKMAAKVVSLLDEVPDVIYSRSCPFSAALLARQIKYRISKPWLMHLSDPWSGSPDRHFSAKNTRLDLSLEAKCFCAADTIALTTNGQAEFYRTRYPNRFDEIIVTPNMLPLSAPAPQTRRHDGTLRLVYTGAFYGAREPSTLLGALELLRDRNIDVANRIELDVFGNASPEIAARIGSTQGCRFHGPVSFDMAVKAQSGADILVTIEPGGENPLWLHFLRSKNLDYIAAGRPILAITPHGSETHRLCAEGQGWSVGPGEKEKLADRLTELVEAHALGRLILEVRGVDHSKYDASEVSAKILDTLKSLAQRELNTPN